MTKRPPDLQGLPLFEWNPNGLDDEMSNAEGDAVPRRASITNVHVQRASTCERDHSLGEVAFELVYPDGRRVPLRRVPVYRISGNP